MGAHYMFLTSMLHLETRILVQSGAPKGAICDAPLGFIVLSTEDDTKTYIPASETVTGTTSVFYDHLWPLRLAIRLPPRLSPSQVRVFLQELDQLLIWDSTFAGSELGLTTAISTRARAATAMESAKMLFQLNLQEENQIIERARGNDSMLAVQPSERWVIHFRTLIRERNKDSFRQVRATVRAQYKATGAKCQLTHLRLQYIEAITKLIEKRGLGFNGAPQVTDRA